MSNSKLKNLLIFTILVYISSQTCQNTSNWKYDLFEPAQIIHYYSTCSQYTKRTCCSIKNIDSLTRRIKKATQSINISPSCKNAVSNILCSLCDADWGQGLYEGICNTNCMNLYQSCRNDLFIVDPNNNRLKPCRQQDLFCWKLKDIVSHFKFDLYQGVGRAQICNLFQISGSQYDFDCWRGQISSQFRGKGKIKLDYTSVKKTKRVKKWWQKYTKQIVYLIIVFVMLGIVLYKFCRPTRPRYYRLN